jgi:predicted ATP-binding protein involved in virulence
MKINNIYAKNFRGIDNCEIFLNGKTTVFFGVNGAGKTALLSLINILFSNIINRVVSSRFKQSINIELSDISYGADDCEIGADIEFLSPDGIFHYSRSMDRKQNKRIHSVNSLKQIAMYFETDFMDWANRNMPIYVNYGVNRLVLDIPLRIRNKHDFDRLSAFEKAIESKIDFRTFFEWFRNQEDYENEVIAKKDSGYKDPALKAVRKAIIGMFDGFKNLHITRNPLAMKIDKKGKSLSIDQLSDGEKCTMALIGDLARRLALANPIKKNPLVGEGVVLIDEVELHMHPQWQRKILPYLMRTFPNIQFIVTTHSPQVLGELDENVNIFPLIRKNGDLKVGEVNSLIGWDANTILEDYMYTHSLNEGIKRLIESIYDAIEAKDIVTAQECISKLKEMTDSNQKDVVRAEILVDRLRMKNAPNSKK